MGTRTRAFGRLWLVRLWVQRFGFFLLVAAGFALLIIGRVDSPWAGRLRAGMLDAVVAHNDLGGRLRAVISVDAVRTFKPHPAVYALGPARLGLARGAIGFVSSNAWDVAGAKAFGFHVVWVNRQQAPLDELGVTPDLEVQTLTELADALGC